MAEWLKAHAWKACLGETLTWVRIPLSPPVFILARPTKSGTALEPAYLAGFMVCRRVVTSRCIRFEIVVRIVVTNFEPLELPRWPQISLQLSNARTPRAMGQASA